MSKTRLWKPNRCFIFEIKGVVPSAIIASFLTGLKFSHWLDESLSEAHNPIALIMNAEEKQRKVLEKLSSRHKDSNRIHSVRKGSKGDKTN